MNDLWKYSPSTNQWTWISGNNTINVPGVYVTKGIPSTLNSPGARWNAMSWIDSNNPLWLFGGQGNDSVGNSSKLIELQLFYFISSYLNDLWKFSPSTNQWTWISGNNTINVLGVYGTRGIPSTSNYPSAQENTVSWIDKVGSLWLFGGYEVDVVDNYGKLIEL